MGIVTVEKLENADKDADALEKFVEGGRTEIVKTRKNKQYPTLENAVYQVIETGGFEPFGTEVELLASTPTLTKKAAKALDTKKVWLWDGNQWNDTGLSEYDLAKEYFDKSINENHESDLFHLIDIFEKIILKVKEDGHVYLTDLDDSVQNEINILKEIFTTNVTDSASVLKVTDDIDRTVIDFTQDGDIKNADFHQGILRELKKDVICARKYTNSSKNIKMKENAAQMHQQRALFQSHVSAPVPIHTVPHLFDFEFDCQKFFQLRVTQPDSRTVLDSVIKDDDRFAHPMISEFWSGSNGYDYLMAITPFYASRDYQENPEIHGTNNFQDFSLINDYIQPLITSPTPHNSTLLRPGAKGVYTYNSDPYFAYDHKSGEIILINRAVFQYSVDDAPHRFTYLNTIRTKDTINWYTTENITKYYDLDNESGLLSPSILYDFDKKVWRMYSISMSRQFEYRESLDLKTWSEGVVIQTPDYITPWHAEVRYVGDKFVVLFSDHTNLKNLLFAYSDDGLTFIYSKNGVLTGKFFEPYKASFLPFFENGDFYIQLLWTNTGTLDIERNELTRWQFFSAQSNLITLSE